MFIDIEEYARRIAAGDFASSSTSADGVFLIFDGKVDLETTAYLKHSCHEPYTAEMCWSQAVAWVITRDRMIKPSVDLNINISRVVKAAREIGYDAEVNINEKQYPVVFFKRNHSEDHHFYGNESFSVAIARLRAEFFYIGLYENPDLIRKWNFERLKCLCLTGASL